MIEVAKRKDLFEQWIEEGEVQDNLAIIQSMAMRGVKLESVAAYFGISERQFHNLKKKHPAIDEVLKKGRERVVALCQSKLLDKVESGDVTAIIYACKVYGGEFFNDRRTPSAEDSRASDLVNEWITTVRGDADAKDK